MGGISGFATKGSSPEFTFSDGAEGHCKPKPSTGSVRVRAGSVGCLVVFLAGVGSLLATEKGNVTGIVAGPSRSPIPGTKVTLAAPDGSRQSVTADQNGHYSFPSVEPGSYAISAEAPGYQTATRTAVRIVGGSSRTVDLLLVVTRQPGPGQTPPVLQPPSYYDDTQLKAGVVTNATDAAGYSSQAQSPQRLLSEGPSLTGDAPKAGATKSGTPDASEAEREFRHALQAHPDSFETNHQLGHFYLSVGDLKAGIPFLEEAQNLEPGNYANGYDLAMAYLGTKNPGAARNLLQGMIQRKETAELHDLLGQADEALGDPISAVNECQRAVQMDPSEKNLFDWGNELLLHESIEPALEVLKRGVALYPDSVRMYIGLGIAFYSRGSYDAAIDALCKASDLNPLDPRPYLFLGKMYSVSTGRANEVAKRMKRFMQTNPDNALAYYYYALCLWKGTGGSGQGSDLADVEALLRKSISLDPRSADAHLQLGVLLHDQHRNAEAIPDFQAAVQLKPDDPDPHYRLAQAYACTGDSARAQEEFQVYIKLHKQQVELKLKNAGAISNP
jgi:tetratricopeptide (TPR) repeat protein